MIVITKHLQTLLCSLVASKGALVGGKAGAEKEIHQILEEVANFVESEDKPTLPNIPSKLLALTREDLKNGVPTVEQIKNWFLYEHDLSGITFYETNDKKLTFASIVRSLDLSVGSQFYDNRKEAIEYSDSYRSGDTERFLKAEEALKAKMPNKKLRYLHWVGTKPEANDIESFREMNTEYF